MLSIKRLLIILLFCVVGFGMFNLYKRDKIDETAAREPLVAGTFYPDNPLLLREAMVRALADVPPVTLKGPLFALIAPHAGYIYSARIAAHSYALLQGRSYKRVVVLAPSHTEPFSYTSVYGGAFYETPLGKLPVDHEFAKKLAQKDTSIRLSNAGHGCYKGRCEHALEVQLPFLQETLKTPTIVPIIMGAVDYDAARALGVALASLIEQDRETQEPDTLIVTSSDLSHFHPYDEAVSLDHKTLGAIGQNDYLSLSINLAAGVWEACGGGPILAAMMATERMGAKARQILAYANSGDVTGDKGNVVGYGAVALFRDDARAQTQSLLPVLEEADKAVLLTLARDAVEKSVRGQPMSSLEMELSSVLQTPLGAFVTLTKNNKLRGCIGFVTPREALAQTVRDVAVLAAREDPRFSPVSEGELGALEYEISVLSPFHRISDLSEIQIGRDGLLIRKGSRQGLLLPQVPLEYGWDVEEFVRHTENKAGLRGGSWKDADTDLFAFSALVFGADVKK